MITLLLTLAIGTAATSAASVDDPKKEVETGSRLARRVEWSERDQLEVRKIQAQYGKCVANKQYEAARNFVLTPNFDRRDFDREMHKVGDADCLLAATAMGGSQMTFFGDTMRYTLADALVRREFATGSSPSLKDVGPIPQPIVDESRYVPGPGKKVKQKELDELAESRRKRLAVIYLAQFGECVVRADTGNSFALLMADPGSTQEGAAFSSLEPIFGDCLIAGQTLSLSKATLRGTVAMNFYRLAHAPQATRPVAGASK